jgi:hypothetical protein
VSGQLTPEGPVVLPLAPTEERMLTLMKLSNGLYAIVFDNAIVTGTRHQIANCIQMLGHTDSEVVEIISEIDQGEDNRILLEQNADFDPTIYCSR